MTPLEPFTSELRALRALASVVLDDQRAARFLRAAASTERLVARLFSSRTTERTANRAAGTRRALESLARAATAPDAPAWVERRGALLAHIERLISACAEAEAAMRAADERIAAAMRAAVAA